MLMVHYSWLVQLVSFVLQFAPSMLGSKVQFAPTMENKVMAVLTPKSVL